jgi:hypothetical protein
VEWSLEIDQNIKTIRMRYSSKLKGRGLSKAILSLTGDLVQGTLLELADF